MLHVPATAAPTRLTLGRPSPLLLLKYYAYGGSDDGKLLYRLAEKRCANFGTCGASGTGAAGTSQVNTELSAR